MNTQPGSDIHHYDQRLTAALSNLENDKNLLDANRRKIKQLHEEESKTDYVMDRLVENPEFKEFVRSKLKTMALTVDL